MEKWFSNRGQMIQVLCAVLAVALGVVLNWKQLSSAFDLVQILKVFVYPAAVLIGFRLGKYQKPSNTFDPRPSVDYKFFTPTIKVGSYFDTESNHVLALSRVSVISIENHKVFSQEGPAAIIETAGTVLHFTPGQHARKLSSDRFLIPANARLKTEEHAIFQLNYEKDSLSLTSISVDHINLPAQEVTFAICVMRYRI